MFFLFLITSSKYLQNRACSI